jgi:Right handed beta helix region
VDYSSIPAALQFAKLLEEETSGGANSSSRRNRRASNNNKSHSRNNQVRSIRVLLRPGRYVLNEAVTVHADPGVVVSLETMELPRNIFRPPHRRTCDDELMEQALPVLGTSSTVGGGRATSAAAKRSPSFRNLWTCSRQDRPEETEMDETESDRDWAAIAGQYGIGSSSDTPAKHATIVLRSRHPNEPAFRVRQGVLKLSNVEIQHNSHGLDIWNGNSAIQVQPPVTEDDHPVPVNPPPSAVLTDVQVTSRSGRGIVSIDGGRLVIRRCAVRDCAATGIYIGGPGSQAAIDSTDVIRNGVGNRARRGIARGHSGVYLEQGVANITGCNISHNTLTGISVVSPDNATITMDNSTLVGNGTYQLELPPPGTPSRQRSVTSNNTLAVRGDPALRSGLTLTESVGGSSNPNHHRLHHHLPLHPEFLGN